MRGRVLLASVLAWTLCTTGAAWSQATPRLPVLSTLSLSRYWFDPLRFGGVQPDRDGSGAIAATGRLGLPVAADVYVGAGLEAWRREVPPTLGGVGEQLEILEYVSQAFLAQAFVQVYPAGARRGVFARVGVGLSRHELQRGAFGNIEKTWDTYPALSAGLGCDLRVLRSVYLSPALDYTRVLAGSPSTDFGVIKRGIGLGLGITVR